MFNLLQNLGRLAAPGHKASRAGAAMALYHGGRPI